MQRSVTLVVVVLALQVAISGPVGTQDATALRVVAVDGTGAPEFDVVVAVPRSLSADRIDREAFTVVAGDQTIPVQATALSDSRLDVAVVLDPALLQPELRDAVVGAVAEFAVGLPLGARIAIDGAPQGATGTGGLTADRGATLAALGALEGSSATLDDALRRLSQLLASDNGRRPALVVLSARPAAEVRTAVGLRSGTVPIYAVVVEADRGAVVPGELPGGGAVLATGLPRLVGALDIITADLTGQYQLSFRLPEGASETVALRVEWRGVAADARLSLGAYAAPAADGVGSPSGAPAGGRSTSDEADGWGWMPWLVAVGALAVAAGLLLQRDDRAEPATVDGDGSPAVRDTAAPPPRLEGPTRTGGSRSTRWGESSWTIDQLGAPDPVSARPVVALVGATAAERLEEALGGGAGLHLEVPTSALEALEHLVREPGAVLVVEPGVPGARRLVGAALGGPCSWRGPIFVIGGDDVLDLDLPDDIAPVPLDQITADAVHEAIADPARHIG